MFFDAAATLPPDTVFLASQHTVANEWALSLLGVIGIGLGSWALGRSVTHGERLTQIETFTGANGNNGLAASVQDMKDTLAELVEIGHANRADLEMLKERSLHTKGA